MRWKRLRSSLSSCSARWERGGSSSRSASSTSMAAARVVRGERSSWLTSELKRASRSIRSCSWSTMALNERVKPSRSGSAASRSSRVSRSPRGDGAGGPRDDGQRSQRARAGEAAQRDAEHGGDAAGREEGEREHAQRVVEVGQVEDIEVVGVHRGDGDPDHDLGRALRGAERLRGRRTVEDDVAQLAGDGGGGDAEGGVVGLGAVEEHGVGVSPRVDVAEETRDVDRAARLQRAAQRAGVEEGLVLVRRLPAGQQEVAHGEVRQPTHQDGEDQRTEPEHGRDAGADAQLHVRAPACSPCPSR